MLGVRWAKFAALALSGKPDPFWPRIALMTQAVMVRGNCSIIYILY